MFLGKAARHWELMIKEGNEGFEVTQEELLQLVAYSAQELAPGDGIKIERLGNGNYQVYTW